MEAPSGTFGYFNTNCFRNEAQAGNSHDSEYFDLPERNTEPGDREFAVEPRRFNRPTLSNKLMLMGLVERTENYNKAMDRKIFTESRIAFEEEQQFRGRSMDRLGQGFEDLAVTNQHVPLRGRGSCFGKMRSNDDRSGPALKVTFASPLKTEHNLSYQSYESSEPVEQNNNNNKVNQVLNFQMPRRSLATQQNGDQKAPRHQFDPSTAYSGRVVPDYRYNYKPDSMMQPSAHNGFTPPPIVASPFRPSQRYPKRPENKPASFGMPKTLSHNYYEINLYGKAQEDRIAQRIEKTVRQTEAPARF